MTGDAPFSNREIREMVKDTNDAIGRVETQTVKTNGRVTQLEKWMYICMGGLSVITVLILPILSWALFRLVNIEETVDSSVKEAFKEVQTGS